MPVMHLPAQKLARLWSAVFNAAGTDKAAYHLYRAVTVEVFDGEGGGVRLVCSNGSFLLRAWVPSWAEIDSDGAAQFDEPGLDISPTHTFVASDVRKRGLSLMGSLAQPPVEGEDDGRTDVVEMTVGRIEANGPQLTLEGLGQSWGLLITSPREQLSLELLGDTPTIWRHYYDEFDPDEVQDARFSQRNLRALAAVKGEAGDVEMRFQGDNRPVLLKVDALTGDVIWGVLMPMRKDAPPEVEAIDDEDDAPEPEPFTPADAEALAAADAAPASPREATDEEVESFLDELGR